MKLIVNLNLFHPPALWPSPAPASSSWSPLLLLLLPPLRCSGARRRRAKTMALGLACRDRCDRCGGWCALVVRFRLRYVPAMPPGSRDNYLCPSILFPPATSRGAYSEWHFLCCKHDMDDMKFYERKQEMRNEIMQMVLKDCCILE